MSDLSGFSHEQLYAAVHDADAGQVEDLAGRYDVLQKEVHTLAVELGADLVRLGEVWRGAAGTTYQETVGTIAGFATALGGDLVISRNKLQALPAAIVRAKRDMPDPADTDDHDKLRRNTMIGGLFGPVIAGVAAVTGYQQDEKEKAAAKARAVQVAQELASAHEANGFEDSPTAPPARLPGSRSAGTAAAASVAAGPVARSVRAGTGGQRPRSRTLGAADDPQGLAPVGGAAGTVPGGGLAGIGHVGEHGTGGQPAAGAVGAAGGPGAGGAFGLGAAGAAGVGAAGVGAARSGAARSGAGRSAAGSGGATGRPLFGTETTRPSTAGSGVLGGADDAGARPAGSTAGGQGGTGSGTGADGRAPFAATGRGAVADEGAEHDTWLTEDEMVWGGDPDAPPSVLGQRN
jgi:hypothetical protein